MDKHQKAALNMAKFIKSQSLDLLGKLEALDLDKHAEICEQLHEQAEVLFQALQLCFENETEL